MDNDGASPCYVKLRDNETTDQPRCSSGGSLEKADNPEGASPCCLTTRPRAPPQCHPPPGRPQGRQRRLPDVGGGLLSLMLLWIINSPIEESESLDSREVRVLICKFKEKPGVIFRGTVHLFMSGSINSVTEEI